MDKLTVGKMAELNNVTRQTLRLYDEIGLLKPGTVGENGYRYYSLSQCARLDMIQYMKSMGMELRTIKEVLDRKDFRQLLGILEQKRDDVDEKIRSLKYQRRAIERTMESYELYTSAPPEGTIVLEYIPRRRIVERDLGINFYAGGLDEYEGLLRSFKQRLTDEDLPLIYFNNAGTILRRERFLAGDFDASEFFVFVDKEFVRPEITTVLPASMYLCNYCNHFALEREYTLRLRAEIEAQGYSVAGDCICEVVVDSTVFEENRREMFFRIQIPIAFPGK